jgi:hypothetical protein
MEYTVCNGDDAHKDNFIKDVNSHLEKGWQLHGNLVVTSSYFPSGGTLFTQAMTRSQKAKEAVKAALPENWESFYDHATGNTWYINNVTGEATYEFPTL